MTNNWDGNWELEITDTYQIVPMDSIYHFIHGHSPNHKHCYETGNFSIVSIDKSPAVEYIRGNTVYYTSQSHLFDVREESILYLLEEWGSHRFDVHQAFKAVYRNDRYIIHDGMHRTSVMYFMGVKYVTLRMVRNWWKSLDLSDKFVE
jgi:hypothetical protein